MRGLQGWLSSFAMVAIGFYQAYLQRRIMPLPHAAAPQAQLPRRVSIWSYKSVAIVVALMLLPWLPQLYAAWVEKSKARVWDSSPNQRIYRQTFVNTTVELDGKSFEYCQFENVTLVYHGTAPFAFIQTTFAVPSSVRLVTDNKAVAIFNKVAAILARSVDRLDSLPGSQGPFAGEIDEKGTIHPF